MKNKLDAFNSGGGYKKIYNDIKKAEEKGEAKKFWGSSEGGSGGKKGKKLLPRLERKLSYGQPSKNNKNFTKVKGETAWKDKDGDIWRKDKLHKDHWDISNKKGEKIMEIDYDGKLLWPYGPKNKNK